MFAIHYSFISSFPLLPGDLSILGADKLYHYLKITLGEKVKVVTFGHFWRIKNAIFQKIWNFFFLYPKGWNVYDAEKLSKVSQGRHVWHIEIT